MVIRAGVDVGGTNTEAVLLDGRQLLGAAKCPTSDDVTEGIVAALSSAIGVAGVSPAAIGRVMIGTTHFTNAVVQRRHLLRTAVIRLAHRRYGQRHGTRRDDCLPERKPHCLGRA